MILPQESVLEKELTKTKSTRAKEKEIPSKKRHRKLETRARKIPRLIQREKIGSPPSQTKKMEMVPKTVHLPGMTGEKNTSKGGKKNTGKSGSKEKNNGDKNGGKACKGQK